VTLTGCNQPPPQVGPFTIQFNIQSCAGALSSGRTVTALKIDDGSDRLFVAGGTAECSNCVTGCRLCA